MAYNPQNPNGQANMANSSPVVIASDQSAVPVSGSVSIGANSSVNLAQVAGTATDVNSGLKSAGTQRVVLATDQPQLTNALKVDGSGVTQPVSGTVTVQQSTAANLKVDLSGTGANTTALKVDGSAVTQPVSAASLPLPTGAATAAKQPALGTAGTASTDVLTVQGITSMTPLKVDGSSSTQPVSGTVTVQQATASNLKVDLSGTGANTTALKVDGSGATQPVSGTVTANAGTGTFNIQSNASVNNAQVGGNATATGNGTTTTGTQRVTLSSDSTGQVALASGSTVGLAAGSNTVGNVGINAGTNAIGTVNLSPSASGGWSVSSQTNLTTTATVSGAAGKFGGYMFINTNSSVAYMQVFDTTGAVTLGTTPPTFVVPIPAGAGANLEITNGVAIANGIKVAATTTATGSTTVSTGLTGFVLYK